MRISSSFALRRNRSLARVGVVAAAALLALAGCAGPDVVVTVTAPGAGASPDASAAAPATPAAPAKPAPAKPAPAKPAPSAPAVPDTGAPSVVVTQGAVAPECTHSVCHYVHVAWKNFDPGVHPTQCVTDHGDLAAWSEGSYHYATADGEMDLGCFLGYAGSHVWVVIDGTLESAHAAWG